MRDWCGLKAEFRFCLACTLWNTGLGWEAGRGMLEGMLATYRSAQATEFPATGIGTFEKQVPASQPGIRVVQQVRGGRAARTAMSPISRKATALDPAARH